MYSFATITVVIEALVSTSHSPSPTRTKDTTGRPNNACSTGSNNATQNMHRRSLSHHTSHNHGQSIIPSPMHSSPSPEHSTQMQLTATQLSTQNFRRASVSSSILMVTFLRHQTASLLRCPYARTITSSGIGTAAA